MPALNKSITVRLMADASNFNAGIRAAGQNAQNLADGMEQSGRKTSLLQTGLAAAGMAATALGAAAVKVASDFDASMSTVQANTHASASEMDLLRQAALDAGADTIYSASEAADGINELGKAGLSTSDILNGGLSGALDLAASEGMDVGEAAELMSTALAQFNLSGDRAADVADALAAGAGNASGSAHDLGMALAQAGTVANSYGVSMEETVGTLSAFAKAGMIGSDAGTSLKSMLQMLGNPTQKAKDEMEALGIEVYDAQGNFIGLSGLAGQLQQSMSGLSQEQRNAALSTIFGSDAVRAANVLYSEGADGIADWTDTVSQSGYAAEMASARTDNLQGDLEQLSGSVETLLINLGEGGQGPLRSLVQTLNTLVDAFSSLPAPVQQTIVLGVVAVGGFTALHKAMAPLNSSASGVAQSFGLLVDPFERIITAAPKLKSGFTDLGTAAGTAVSGMSGLLGTATSGQRALSGLKSIGGGLIDLMGGPWGIAFGVAAAALASWVKKSAEAKAQAEELQTALETTGDATEQIIDDLTNAEIDDSWLIPDNIEQAIYGYKTVGELVEDVGIKMSDMALAVQGNEDAMKRITDVTDSMVEAGGKQADLAGIILNYLNEEKDVYNDSAEAAESKAQAMDEVAEATGGASDATSDNASSMSEAEDAAQDYADAISDLLDNLFELEDTHISAYEAQTRFSESVASLTDSLAENGYTLDLSTEKGRANRDSLSDLASQAIDTANAILEEGQATGTMDDATAKAKTTLEQAREAFIKAATACGMTREDAEALADQFGLTGSKADGLKQSIDNIPNSKTVALTLQGFEDAYKKVDDLSGKLSTIQSKDVTIRTNLITNEVTLTTSGGLRGDIDPFGNTGGLFTGNAFVGYANGGPVMNTFDGYVDPVWAPGTGLSDSVYLTNARIAAGEYVHNAKAVDYYGTGIMRALNERAIPRELFAGAATTVNRPVNVVINVQGGNDPRVTARQTFELFRSELAKVG